MLWPGSIVDLLLLGDEDATFGSYACNADTRLGGSKIQRVNATRAAEFIFVDCIILPFFYEYWASTEYMLVSSVLV